MKKPKGRLLPFEGASRRKRSASTLMLLLPPEFEKMRDMFGGRFISARIVGEPGPQKS